MKSDPPPSYTPTSDATLAERLTGVLSLHEATALLNDNLWSIPSDSNKLAFGFGWNFATLEAFVVAANTSTAPDPVRAPAWLRTRPPNITVHSFTNDVVQELAQVAGDHAGSWRSVLVANMREQFVPVAAMLITLQDDEFIQTVAQAAFPPPAANEGERYLATTYCLSLTSGEERAVNNNLPPPRRNGDTLLRQVFI